MTKTADKLAALEAEVAAQRARVEELERKAKPPAPFVPIPYERFDPTARMSMPPSALAEMVNAVPDHVVRGVIRDNRAPTGPSSAGAIPSSQQISNVRTGGGTGWAHEVPLGNPPGTRMVDAICVADDVRQKAELKRKMGGG
jgi:hypothetical protein